MKNPFCEKNIVLSEMMKDFNMSKVGDKVLVRIMECVSKETDSWEIKYKVGVIRQGKVLYFSGESLCTVELADGQMEHVWARHILEYPEGWT